MWQYRFDPPAFTLAVGSCVFINEPQYDRPGRPYGGNYEIFESLADSKPDAMLWLGDNAYFREVDFYSLSGMATPLQSPAPSARVAALVGQLSPLRHLG